MSTMGCCLIIAVVVGIICVWLAIPAPPIALSPDPHPKPSPLSPEQISAFQQDGILMIPGLFSGDELAAMIDGGKDVAASWGSIFDFFSHYGKLDMDLWRVSTPFAKVAFESPLPTMASQLLARFPASAAKRAQDISDGEGEGQGEIAIGGAESRPLRILKDAFFNYKAGGEGCGWHVDDKGFWPASDESSGVTFWVALSNITTEEGGGLMLAQGSHLVEWAGECRQAINPKTCSMRETSPECWEKLDAIGKSWDMKPGDVLAWERWIFHRSIPFKVDIDRETGRVKQATTPPGDKLRYSIRYVPNDARVNGIVHSSIQQGGSFESPYYPQAWPAPLQSEVEFLRSRSLGKDQTLGGALRFMLIISKRRIGKWLHGAPDS
ncbi:unnamed protein product [Discosporangium mesarthrocarpum]